MVSLLWSLVVFVYSNYPHVGLCIIHSNRLFLLWILPRIRSNMYCREWCRLGRNEQDSNVLGIVLQIQHLLYCSQRNTHLWKWLRFLRKHNWLFWCWAILKRTHHILQGLLWVEREWIWISSIWLISDKFSLLKN